MRSKSCLATYASGQALDQRVLDDGCKELTFSEGEFRYRDRYYGFDPFIGEEVVFRAGKAAWAMNYCGGLSGGAADAGQVYAFLQKAMRLVRAERPFRGPEHFAEGEFDYRDESEGTPERFSGEERIFFRGECAYRLLYHGGVIRAIASK